MYAVKIIREQAVKQVSISAKFIAVKMVPRVLVRLEHTYGKKEYNIKNTCLKKPLNKNSYILYKL